MKIKYFVFVIIFVGMLFSFYTVKVKTSSALAMPMYSGYCRVTGSLEGIRKDSLNPNVFIMLYKIQKVEQLRSMPGYDCHGFVVGAIAGLGLDNQITDNNFSVTVGQNFVADFDENDKFIQFSSQQDLSCLDFTRDLVYSNRNSDVTLLQQFLIGEGYLTAQATGYFGLMTKSAVIAFQKDYSLLTSGKVDANTRAKIKELTCSGNITKAKLGEICNPPSIECETNLYCAYSIYPRQIGVKGICEQAMMVMKPVIYLYPETKQEVSVKLFYSGELNASLPDYNKKINGWNVTAYPNGKIINSDGREYSYLFWEGKDNVKYDISSGFIVKGSDTREFLMNTLSKMGLTPKEYNEFIVFWYPKMQENAYNLVHFAEKEYTDNAKLEIIPKPDSIQRVFMVWKGLDKPIKVIPQEIKPFYRKGFSVIEWGGQELK